MEIPSEQSTERLADTAQLAFEGAHRALQYANRMACKKGQLTEDIFKKIHEACMDSLLPDSAAGRYRTSNVGITGASITPPDWSEVPMLMQKFTEELSERFKSCGRGVNCLPCLITTLSFAHYAFARIHPFEDGNGRTVRIMCDMIAKKFDLKPIIIWPQEKGRYINSLEAVNRSGNLAHLESLFIDCLLERYSDGELKGKNGEIYQKLQQLKEEKIEEISSQSGESNIADIWPVFALPCFD